MKNGFPPNAIRGYPSRRRRAGAANPASIRAESFVDPARPESDKDALSVRTAPQSRTASVYAAAASGNGAPVPEGSVTRRLPQEVVARMSAQNPIRASVARGLDTRPCDINV